MVNPPINDDFYAKALSSFNHQMSLANIAEESTATARSNIPIMESYAKSLVENDLPKIDSAVKSYLSLVAARSAVASDIDVISVSSKFKSTSNGNDSAKRAMTEVVQCQCTFATSTSNPMDANRCALICARTLLATMNSTTIPSESSDKEQASSKSNSSTNNDDKQIQMELQNNAIQILWNGLLPVKVSPSTETAGDLDKAKQAQTKPSKILGRKSLSLAYPYIKERFRRGILLKLKSNDDDSQNNCDAPSSIHIDATEIATTAQNNQLQLESLPNELLPPVPTPKGIDIDQWKAFYTEFGNLLEDSQSSPKVMDDSPLLWSNDQHVGELQRRREMRAQRATEALASSSVDNAKAAVAEAVGEAIGSVTHVRDGKVINYD